MKQSIQRITTLAAVTSFLWILPVVPMIQKILWQQEVRNYFCKTGWRGIWKPDW